MIDVIQIEYGASYQEARRLWELKDCRYSIWIVEKTLSGPVTAHCEWTGLALPMLVKYKWYFKYRASLLQIAHPKKHFFFTINRTFETADQRKALIQTITNKLRNAKSKLTQATTKLNLIKSGWNELFPVEQHPDYKKVEQELERREARIRELQSDLDKTNNDDIFDLLKKHYML